MDEKGFLPAPPFLLGFFSSSHPLRNLLVFIPYGVLWCAHIKEGELIVGEGETIIITAVCSGSKECQRDFALSRSLPEVSELKKLLAHNH